MHLEPGRELGSEGKARLLRAVGAEEWGDCGSGAGARWRGGAGFWRGRILGVRGGFGHGRVAAGGWEGGVWCPSEVSVVEEEVRR